MKEAIRVHVLVNVWYIIASICLLVILLNFVKCQINFRFWVCGNHCMEAKNTPLQSNLRDWSVNPYKSDVTAPTGLVTSSVANFVKTNKLTRSNPGIKTRYRERDPAAHSLADSLSRSELRVTCSQQQQEQHTGLSDELASCGGEPRQIPLRFLKQPTRTAAWQSCFSKQWRLCRWYGGCVYVKVCAFWIFLLNSCNLLFGLIQNTLYS